MKNILILFTSILCYTSINAQLYDMIEYYDSVHAISPQLLPKFEDSTHTFKAVNSKNQRLEIRFRNIATWQHAKLNYSDLESIFQEVNGYISENHLNPTSGKKIFVHTLPSHQNIIRIQETNKDELSFIQRNDGTHPLKLTQDTLHVISEYMNDKKQKSMMIYTFFINDIQNIEELQMEEFIPFLDSINTTMHHYASKWKHENAPSKKIIGIYAQDKFESKNISLSNAFINHFFLDVSTGVYLGTNVGSSLIIENTLGYKPTHNSFFIGLNHGTVFNRITENNLNTFSFLAVEVGSVYQHFANRSILKGNRASMAIGIFNVNPKLYHKPAFYMGINFPITNTIQFSMHIATDYKGKKGDPEKNVFGLSLKYSIGGLFNKYSINY